MEKLGKRWSQQVNYSDSLYKMPPVHKSREGESRMVELLGTKEEKSVKQGTQRRDIVRLTELFCFLIITEDMQSIHAKIHKITQQNINYTVC